MKYLYTSVILMLVMTLSGFGQKAFPGAEGFGSNTRGAYSGSSSPKILKVISYADTETGSETKGEGTLRWCLTRTYPRIVLFQVGGTFELFEAIQIRNPYISVYGQTAPAPGVLIIGTGLDVRTHDVIIQHLAVRPGDNPDGPTPGGRDGIELRRSARNIIIDHCSIQWAIDENLSTWADGERISRVTFSNCIVAEGLENSLHNEGPHSKGILIALSSDSISLIKNYIAHNGDRNPYIQGGTRTEVINNLIYNGKNGILFHDYATLPTITSVINNHVYKGADFTSNYNVRVQSVSSSSKFYLSGNSDGSDGWDGVRDDNKLEPSIRVNIPPIQSSGLKILNRDSVVNHVLKYVGARNWARDEVDKRIVNSFINRTGRIPDCVEGCSNSAGGWNLYAYKSHTLIIPSNPHKASAGGYTNLELWVSKFTEISEERFTDNAPVIDPQQFVIMDSKSYPQKIGEIKAYDEDNEPVTKISIIGGNNNNYFTLGSNILSLTNYPAVTTQTSHKLILEITDYDNPSLKDTATVSIKILPLTGCIYIDPSESSQLAEYGTIENPYHSWQSIPWSNGYKYLQKKGTTATEDEIVISAVDIEIASYGEGDAPHILSTSSTFAISAYEKNKITIKDIAIKAEDAVSCLYFIGAEADSIQVENCILEGAENGIRIIEGKNFELRFNIFRNLKEAVYSFAESTNINYNAFNNNSTGINIGSNLSTSEIYNNVFHNNNLAVTSSYATLILKNNIFYSGNAGQLAFKYVNNQFVSDYNIFYPEQAGFISASGSSFAKLSDYQKSSGQDLHSKNSDPLFVNILNNDYSVFSNSPTIDAGQDVGLNTDFYGSSVPAGGNTDIGLAENSRSATPVTKIDKSNENGMIYPNPSNGRFFVRLSESLDEVSLEIKNLAGNTILNLPSYSNTAESIDLSNFPKGIYLVKIINKGLTSIEKAIVY